MSRFKRLARASALGAWISTAPVLAAPQPAPVTAFAALPAVADIGISPNGEHLLIMKAVGETHHPVVLDIAKGESKLVLAADPGSFLFNWCRFANDTRIVCSIRRYDTLQASQIGLGYRRYADGRVTFTRMLAVDRDGGNVLNLVATPQNREAGELKWNPVDQDDVIAWLPDDPEHILVQLARDDRARPSVYRLNLYDNGLFRVRRHHDSVNRWFADRDGEIRFATGIRDLNPVAFSVIANRLREVDIGRYLEPLPPDALGLSGDGRTVYFASYHEGGRRAIYAADAATGEARGRLFDDPDYDVFGALVRHPVTGAPVLLRYVRDALTEVWFDPTLRERLAPAYAALEAVHARVLLEAADTAQNRFVLYGEGNGTAPSYYLYDRARQSLDRIASTYPDIPRVVEPQAVRYPARDGHSIPGYLYLPEGPGPHPTVVYPHGGPNLRDDASFDYWSQFFVSRGYAVLKPNFRGSIGYGATHLAAGFEQWGLRMQDDVIDGLDWLVAEKITDPARVCIVGGSYGGYVALVAAYKTPERIRCAVSFAGVTDLASLKERIGNFDFGELSLARIQDGAAVAENSPLRQAERIRVPLLIVHGDLDRSVMIEQSRDLVTALEALGKPHRYIEQTNGDHFLSLARHRLELFEAMDAFLGEHLDP